MISSHIASLTKNKISDKIVIKLLLSTWEVSQAAQKLNVTRLSRNFYLPKVLNKNKKVAFVWFTTILSVLSKRRAATRHTQHNTSTTHTAHNTQSAHTQHTTRNTSHTKNTQHAQHTTHNTRNTYFEKIYFRENWRCTNKKLCSSLEDWLQELQFGKIRKQ